jgi:hypothetical protein
MPRNRVIYQSEAVFVGPIASTPVQMRRVQSCNYNFAIERTDINQFGELASLERLILREPTVSVDMSYYFDPSLTNEGTLGLLASTGFHALSSIASGTTAAGEKNIFIGTTPIGSDANVSGSYAATFEGVIGIGNSFLTSWSLEAAVGAIPTVSCAFEGQNMRFGTSFVNPSISTGGIALTDVAGNPTVAAYVNSEVAAIRPGNVTVLLGALQNDNTPIAGFSELDLKFQSATVAVTLSREPIRKLGQSFAFSRELTFPIMCTMSVTAIVGEQYSSGGLTSLLSLMGATGDNAKYTCQLTLVGNPANGGSAVTAVVAIKGAKLNSQNTTSSIGPNKSITIELSAQAGKDSGLFISTS